MEPRRYYQVDHQTQATALNFANHVILDVKLARPYGAGNLKWDVRPAYPTPVCSTRRQSVERTRRAYVAWQDQLRRHETWQGTGGWPRERRRETLNPFKPKLLAGIATMYGAGKCDMAGAMAYTLLRGNLDHNFEVMLIQRPRHNNADGISDDGHTYAGFKYQGTENSEAIIVDPWPTFAMATLAEHHFMWNPEHIIIRKPGNLDPRIPLEKRQYTSLRELVNSSIRYDTLAAQMDHDCTEIEREGDWPGRARHDWLLCSNVVTHYKDTYGNLLPLPLERLRHRMRPSSAPTTLSFTNNAMEIDPSTTPSTNAMDIDSTTDAMDTISFTGRTGGGLAASKAVHPPRRGEFSRIVKERGYA
jgi:hypothetical protein